MSIPTLEVHGTYLMDPETEDLIWGSDLREGMVVLIEDALIGRGGFTSTRDLKTTRWCRVTGLSIGRAGGSTNNLVRFIGEYADGSKFSRTYSDSFAWFVKRDSIGGAA